MEQISGKYEILPRKTKEFLGNSEKALDMSKCRDLVLYTLQHWKTV